MRTTLAIDDDILAAARRLANRHDTTIGAVISLLVRQGLGAAAPQAALRVRNGIPLLPRHTDAAPVTLECVNQLRDGLS